MVADCWLCLYFIVGAVNLAVGFICVCTAYGINASDGITKEELLGGYKQLRQQFSEAMEDGAVRRFYFTKYEQIGIKAP